MALQRHYPHLTFHAVRDSHCRTPQHAVSRMIAGLRIGVRGDPRIRLTFSVCDSRELARLVQSGYKQQWKSCLSLHRSMRASQAEVEVAELKPDAKFGFWVSLGQRGTGEETYIPRWEISYETPLGSSDEACRAEMYVMKPAYEIHECSPEDRHEIINTFLDAIDVTDDRWDYAYFEIADETEHMFGRAYNGQLGNPIRWHDAVRYRLWQVASGDEFDLIEARRKRHPCKAVYWGNFFGQGILDRLGGKRAFLKDFNAARRTLLAEDAWHRSIHSGVFVALSSDVLHSWYVTAPWLPPLSPHLRMAAWLWERLRSADLLL